MLFHKVRVGRNTLWTGIGRLAGCPDGVVIDAVDEAGAAVADADEVMALCGELTSEVGASPISAGVAGGTIGI